MSKEELVSLSSVEMRRRIGTKEISPVELLDACLERIEEVNPAVNAVTAMCVDRARKEAKAAEAAVRRGEDLPLLHGLPTGIKDLEETKDLLTTYGSPLYRDYVPGYDNVMVGRVRAAGAVIVGKTNVPEFGAGSNSRNPVWGATGNPFNPMLNAGGSSGGSAAALATDMLPVCTGSDTGGSLRNPAAFCGVVGFRPSPGMVAVERRAMGWTPISVLGPMGRSVADVCLLFATQVGQHDSDPLSFPLEPEAYADPWPVDLGSLRVAYTEDFGGAPVEKSIRQTFREKIKAMKPFFRSLDKVDVDYGGADRCFDVIRAVSFLSRYHDAYANNREMLAEHHRQLRTRREAQPGRLRLGAWRADADLPGLPGDLQGLRPGHRPDRRLLALPLEAALHRGDGRKKLGTYYHWMATKYFVTLTSNPAVSLPCGVDEQDAVRPAGGRPLPRRRRGAGRRPRHGAGVQDQPGARPAAAQHRQAAQAGAGAEVDRDPSAEAQRQGRARPGPRRL